MKIREASIEDVSDISRLIRSLSHYFLEVQGTELPQWFLDTITIDAISERIYGSDFLNLVCVAENKIIGYLSIRNHSHIFHLFVAEGQHKKGVARALWDQSRLITNSEKYTIRSSLYAIPVYQSFGFEICGEPLTKEGIAFQPMELYIKPKITKV